jgi:2,3-bisphosphoglycerate-independent phosphoglycerate mutase
MKPEMSAYEVTDAIVEKIREKKYDTIILNYANPDMVGHTGVLEAAVQAVEVIDKCVGRVVEEFLRIGGSVLITADHGNVEEMIDEKTGGPQTAHTSNIVPFIVIGEGDVKLREDGILADVAPTIIDVMGLRKPDEMTGQSIINR